MDWKVCCATGDQALGEDVHCDEDVPDAMESLLDPRTILPSPPSTPAKFEDTSYGAVSGSDKWNNNADLRQFWADGKGNPNPFTYHPDLEAAYTRRLSDFARLEAAYLQKHCSDEEFLMEVVDPLFVLLNR